MFNFVNNGKNDMNNLFLNKERCGVITGKGNALVAPYVNISGGGSSELLVDLDEWEYTTDSEGKYILNQYKDTTVTNLVVAKEV